MYRRWAPGLERRSGGTGDSSSRIPGGGRVLERSRGYRQREWWWVQAEGSGYGWGQRRNLEERSLPVRTGQTRLGRRQGRRLRWRRMEGPWGRRGCRTEGKEPGHPRTSGGAQKCGCSTHLYDGSGRKLGGGYGFWPALPVLHVRFRLGLGVGRRLGLGGRFCGRFLLGLLSGRRRGRQSRWRRGSTGSEAVGDGLQGGESGTGMDGG